MLARRERDDDRGFEVVGRRDAGRFDLALLRVFPVVVAHDERAILIKFQRRIGQDVG